mmetsp:Transcript_27495/g.80846  ORF Transcript_27495/g.80846 Transcript_27495/m.80846 type:complete len:235 (+) Transcript_27495:707-1411(+)
MLDSPMPVSAVRRAVRALTCGSLTQASVEHQHCVDVRTGDTWSPAMLRAKESLQCPRMAWISSSRRKSWKARTHGSLWSTCGLYSGKSARARSKRALRPPGCSVMAREPSVLLQADLRSSQVPQATGHDPRMYFGLFSHSPAVAHAPQLGLSSLHASSSSSLAAPALGKSGFFAGAQALQLRLQASSMKPGLAVHSPLIAHVMHSLSESTQSAGREAISALRASTALLRSSTIA